MYIPELHQINNCFSLKLLIHSECALSWTAVCFGLSSPPSPLSVFSFSPTPSPSFSSQSCVMWCAMIETTSSQSQRKPSPLPLQSLIFLFLLSAPCVCHPLLHVWLAVQVGAALLVHARYVKDICVFSLVNHQYQCDLINTQSVQREVWWCVREWETQIYMVINKKNC